MYEMRKHKGKRMHVEFRNLGKKTVHVDVFTLNSAPQTEYFVKHLKIESQRGRHVMLLGCEYCLQVTFWIES